MKIKTETPSARCEICHQSDWYDSLSNRCTRCESSQIATRAKEALLNADQVDRKVERREPSKLSAISDFIKPIFIKWEKLRIVYNLVLLITVVGFNTMSMGISVLTPFLLITWVFGAILANFCFLAGPIIESYVSWLGLRSNIVTAILFMGGLLISIPLSLLFTLR